jgi:hypothetical protein
MNEAPSRIAFPESGSVTAWKAFFEQCREVNRLAHEGPGATPRAEPFRSFLFVASDDANPRLASYPEQMKQHGMQPSVDEAYRLGMYLLTSLGSYPVLYSGDELMRGWRIRQEGVRSPLWDGRVAREDLFVATASPQRGPGGVERHRGPRHKQIRSQSLNGRLYRDQQNPESTRGRLGSVRAGSLGESIRWARPCHQRSSP